MRDTEREGREMQAEGRWDRIRGRVRSTWGDLTDDEIDQGRGNTEELIGRIKEKTGEAVGDIRRKLDEIFSDEGEPSQTRRY